MISLCARPVLLASLALAGTALAGCGGSSSSSSSASAPAVAAHARPASHGPALALPSPDTGQAPVQLAAGRKVRAGSRQAHGETIVGPTVKVRRALRQSGAPSDDQNVIHNAGINPCTLVTLPEAQAITAGSVAARTEARQGPTCIYKLRHSQPAITMVVEAVRISEVTHQLAKPQLVKVAGHRAYCGRLGLQMLFVPLKGNQLLNVTASCPVAKRFAALALSRLAA